jgi:hypothetical protein
MGNENLTIQYYNSLPNGEGNAAIQNGEGLPVVGCGGRLMDITTEYTEQQSLSGVHSIMRVKLAQAGDGGGCMPTPFHYIYHLQ